MNKALAIVTYHPSVWNELLKHARSLPYSLPLPPLNPTPVAYPGSLSSSDTERLVTHAHALSQAWRRPDPALKQWSFDMYWTVKEMVVLPGCKHMVASVYDEQKEEWAVVVYVLGLGEAWPISRTATGTRAYALQAKYFNVPKNGEELVIAYVTQRGVAKGDEKATSTEYVYISSFRSRIAADQDCSSTTDNKVKADADKPITVYECHSMCIKLFTTVDLIEAIPPKASKDSFSKYLASLESHTIVTASIRSSYPLSHVNLSNFSPVTQDVLLSVVEGSKALLCKRILRPNSLDIRLEFPPYDNCEWFPDLKHNGKETVSTCFMCHPSFLQLSEYTVSPVGNKGSPFLT